MAKIAGFQDWAAARGIPVAKSTQCLTDQNALNQLVQMASDTTTQYPSFVGTPTFIINGTMVDEYRDLGQAGAGAEEGRRRLGGVRGRGTG